MTTPTATAPAQTAPTASTHSQPPQDLDPHKQGGLRRMVVSLARLADIQGRLWLTELKLTTLKLALYSALFAAAALFALLGIIFLLIGLFHVLTDLLHLQTVYALLIFGTAQLLLAALIALIAKHQLAKPKPSPPHSRTAP